MRDDADAEDDDNGIEVARNCVGTTAADGGTGEFISNCDDDDDDAPPPPATTTTLLEGLMRSIHTCWRGVTRIFANGNVNAEGATRVDTHALAMASCCSGEDAAKPERVSVVVDVDDKDAAVVVGVAVFPFLVVLGHNFRRTEASTDARISEVTCACWMIYAIVLYPPVRRLRRRRDGPISASTATADEEEEDDDDDDPLLAFVLSTFGDEAEADSPAMTVPLVTTLAALR